MVNRFISRLSLLTRFSLLTLTVTILIAAALAYRLETTLVNDALWGVAENAQAQVNYILNHNLGPADFDSQLPPARYREIDALIHSTLLNADIVRVKIWSPDGRLIYCDEASAVGQKFPIEPRLQSALNGQMTTLISTLQGGENVTERGQFTELYAVYVPLYIGDSGKVFGAYEVYYDLRALEPRLASIRVTVFSGVGLGLLLLYSALFVLVRNASRQLIQRNEENHRLLVAEREQRDRAQTLERVSLALSENLDLRKLLDLICHESLHVFGAHSAFLWMIEGDELVGFAAYGKGSEEFKGLRYSLYDPDLLGARVMRERKPVIVNDAPNSEQVDQKLIKFFEIKSMLGVPLIRGESVFGSLMIIDTENPGRFVARDLGQALVFSSHAAVAIDNAKLYEKARIHLAHERSLREIDRAITGNLDLPAILDMVLGQAHRRLGVQASTLLLLDTETRILKYSNGIGFKDEETGCVGISLEDETVGRALQEFRTFGRPNILDPDEIPCRAELIRAHGFCAYFVAPLISKDRILGALEVFLSEPLRVKADWLNFLEALAGQAAIAIEQASLLRDLQHSNANLIEAYDATIEGWSAALDLRDRETEGHTQRVTEMTLKLAKKLGFSDQQLVHVRRGALLHDIGKMGIPDHILLKTTALSDDEWEIMHNHPVFAYEFMKSIAYLRDACSIPYSHHECWDGSGYPCGLRGEEIPLEARVFAVVDVWDAITSDRPYRKAWPREQALAYIREKSGTQFDPRLVEKFMEMIEGD